ncbi:MAG TPA: hypothetical protein VLA54_12810 [Acidimicrobiia bacterium]|jgi:hypothetical protein|nr:hypothetical protein [Acidimicrobiia bacterium]
MTAMMFAYVAARQLEIERQANCRAPLEQAHPMRDRLGRTLISLGEHLLGVSPLPSASGQTVSVRRAA